MTDHTKSLFRRVSAEGVTVHTPAEFFAPLPIGSTQPPAAAPAIVQQPAAGDADDAGEQE